MNKEIQSLPEEEVTKKLNTMLVERTKTSEWIEAMARRDLFDAWEKSKGGKLEVGDCISLNEAEIILRERK